MKPILSLIVFFLCITSILAENTTIVNPVKHFMNYHRKNHMTKHKIMFFEVDVNGDSKADLFISSDSQHLHNGQLGRVYFVYLTDKNKYFWEDDNSVTLHYSKLIFNKKQTKNIAPLILVEEDSVWAGGYLDNVKNVYELLDIKWGDHPHSSNIIHDILTKSNSEEHPLITVKKEKALSYWKMHMEKKNIQE
ncbi:MAG TPA: hypothetical protein QF753_19575 [Victivallales bacterium]|nr:hypothetical protein [Victivallales bacterium]